MGTISLSTAHHDLELMLPKSPLQSDARIFLHERTRL
jgi:hypothetical protein